MLFHNIFFFIFLEFYDQFLFHLKNTKTYTHTHALANLKINFHYFLWKNSNFLSFPPCPFNQLPSNIPSRLVALFILHSRSKYVQYGINLYHFLINYLNLMCTFFISLSLSLRWFVMHTLVMICNVLSFTLF